MSWKSLGKFIRYKRDSLGLTRHQFDLKFHIAEGTLRNLEGGHSNFSSTQILEFAQIFEIRPGILADLLGDAITYEQAVKIDEHGGTFTYGSQELKEGQFILLPDNLPDIDVNLLKTLANRLSDKNSYEDDREARLKVTKEEVIREGFERQEQLTNIISGGKEIKEGDNEKDKAS